jgi:hypothetical protein
MDSREQPLWSSSALAAPQHPKSAAERDSAKSRSDCDMHQQDAVAQELQPAGPTPVLDRACAIEVMQV